MRDDHTRLQDILEAVERIEKYAPRGRAAFEHDELVQTWIIHHLLVLGEAAGWPTQYPYTPLLWNRSGSGLAGCGGRAARPERDGPGHSCGRVSAGLGRNRLSTPTELLLTVGASPVTLTVTLSSRTQL